MKTNKLLVLVIIILILLNVGTLSFLWFTKEPTSKHIRQVERPHIEGFLKRRLDLDQSQLKLFREARKEHFAESGELMKKMHAYRKKLLILSKNGEDKVKVDSLLHQLADMHIQLERMNYQHMIELRSYCNENQQIRFDSVMMTMFERLSNPEKRRLRKHRKHR